MKARERTRYLRRQELPAFREGLCRVPLLYQVFFWVCLLCGSRRGETLSMRWVDLDLEAGVWEKPAWTTKTGLPHIVPLHGFLMKKLAELPRINEYVFPSPLRDGLPQPISQARVEQVWRKVRAGWGEDLWIHDLRRTCATWMAMGGENLTAIQHTLGHVNLKQTHRYARYNLEALRGALSRTADTILTQGGDNETVHGGITDGSGPERDRGLWPER